MNRLISVSLGILVGIGLVLGAWFLTQRNYTFQGTLIDPPVQAAEISLYDQHGKLFRLSEQRGNVVLIFFGYTNCPDVCPITLSEYKKIKASLGQKAENARFVFITVDPERDTQERLNLYLENFDTDFIGLTAERASLEQVWKDYGVYQERQQTTSAAGYLVDHSARLYIIDAQGNWRLNYTFGEQVEKIIDDVNHLLKEGV